MFFFLLCRSKLCSVCDRVRTLDLGENRFKHFFLFLFSFVSFDWDFFFEKFDVFKGGKNDPFGSKYAKYVFSLGKSVGSKDRI